MFGVVPLYGVRSSLLLFPFSTLYFWKDKFHMQLTIHVPNESCSAALSTWSFQRNIRVCLRVVNEACRVRAILMRLYYNQNFLSCAPLINIRSYHTMQLFHCIHITSQLTNSAQRKGKSSITLHYKDIFISSVRSNSRFSFKLLRFSLSTLVFVG